MSRVLACAIAVLFSAQPTTGVAWLIFVDDLHLEFRNTGRIRDMVRTIGRELIVPGDIVAMRSSGPRVIVMEPTGDRAIFDTAVRNITGNGLRAGDIIRMARDNDPELRSHADRAVARTRELIAAVRAAGSRPRAIIYISNGYRAEGAAELARAAAGEVIPIFAFDPRLLYAEPLDPVLDPEGWRIHWTATRGSLRQLSELSGGFAWEERQDLVETVKRVATAVRK